MRKYYPLFIFLLVYISCKKEESSTVDIGDITIDSVLFNNAQVQNSASLKNINTSGVTVSVNFNKSVDTTRFKKEKITFSGGIDTLYTYSFSTSARTLNIHPTATLKPLVTYRFLMDIGKNMGGTVSSGFSFQFTTMLDSTKKYPAITDDSLLTLVQKQTFKFFWDYGHPTSGLARERNGSGDLVTIGGSGFGMMSVLVAIHRGFITRQKGYERLNKMVQFLNLSTTDKFHGAFPHWMNGSTGKVIAFSTKDNGGDLVETSYLAQGLLTVKQFFKDGSTDEKAMCDTIGKLWENIEWSWYRQNDQNKLYWHWSPNYNWDMNMPITGWNEALIVYVLAASSPTYPIPKNVYDEGWAQNGEIKNGNTYYNIQLPLGESKGGPMFFAHYSFLGLDPRNLQDAYANYWTQNTAHAQINYAYCKANPKNQKGYSGDFWGLTASDIQDGYTASSPNNDGGTIAPTAALSDFPYTPEESMKALRFFYYILGDKLWGNYGFYDAVNLNQLWYANSYLAIDQGPIICMIENYRSQLLWNLFMQDAEVKNGLNLLGFTY